MGTFTTRKSTSRFLALVLLPKHSGRWTIPMGFSSCPPKPKMGCTRGTISLPRYSSFFKHSQVMVCTELPVSIRILRTIALATFISTTNRSLCRKVKCRPFPPPNTNVSTVIRLPCLVVRTCYAPWNWVFHANWMIPSAYPPMMVATIPVEHSSSRCSGRVISHSFRRNRDLLFKNRSICPLSTRSWRVFLNSHHSTVMCPFCSWNSKYFCELWGLGVEVIDWGLFSIGCSFTSISILLRFVVKRRSTTSCLGLRFPRPRFLSIGPWLSSGHPCFQHKFRWHGQSQWPSVAPPLMWSPSARLKKPWIVGSLGNLEMKCTLLRLPSLESRPLLGGIAWRSLLRTPATPT